MGRLLRLLAEGSVFGSRRGVKPVKPRSASRLRASDGLFGVTAGVTVFKVVSAAATALVAIVSARQLGPSGRGILVLLITVASLSLLVCSLGINVSGRIHLVGQAKLADSSDYLGLSIVLVSLQCVVTVLVGVNLLRLVHVRLSLPEVVLFSLLGGLLLAQHLTTEAIYAYGHARVAAAVDAAGSIVQLGAVVVLAQGSVTTVDLYLVALLVGGGFQVALAMATLRGLGVSIRPRYRRAPWVLLVRRGLPGIATAIAQVLTFRMDRYLVGVFLTPGAVGVYSVAATAPELLRLPLVALGQPIFFRLASGSAELRDFRRIRLICLLATASLAATLAVLAPFLVRTIFGSEFAGAVTPMRILLLAEAGIALYSVDGPSLVGVDRVRDASLAAVAALVVVAIGDLILIPAFGLAGAAWASVVAYSVMGFVAHMLLRRWARAQEG